MLSIFMVPVYGEDTTGHKAGRAGFAMSKMVARACNLLKQISSFVL